MIVGERSVGRSVVGFRWCNPERIIRTDKTIDFSSKANPSSVARSIDRWALTVPVSIVSPLVLVSLLVLVFAALGVTRNGATMIPAAGDPWVITPREYAKFQEQFRTLQPLNEMVTGAQAREFFLKSQLPPMVLGEIW